MTGKLPFLAVQEDGHCPGSNTVYLRWSPVPFPQHQQISPQNNV